MDKSYFLMYENNHRVNDISFFQKVFHDISEIDVLTLEYTREQFKEMLVKELPYLSFNMCLFIALHPTDFQFKLFDCLFLETENPHRQKIILLLKKLAVQRFQNLNEHQPVTFQKHNPDFQELTRILLKNITSDERKRRRITQDSSFVNPLLKTYLLKANTTKKYDFYYPKMQEILTSYTTLRNLVVLYLQMIATEKNKSVVDFMGYFPMKSEYTKDEISILKRDYEIK